MNTQEAYRQLDLAQGLDFDRVQSQYNSLKSGLSEKIAGTSNAALKDVYQKRLDEVEQAYKVLVPPIIKLLFADDNVFRLGKPIFKLQVLHPTLDVEVPEVQEEEGSPTQTGSTKAPPRKDPFWKGFITNIKDWLENDEDVE